MNLALKKQLVEDWWRAYSVHLLIVANVIAEAASYLPEIQQALPSNWYTWAFRIILIARLYKQNRSISDAK